jgi:predicted ATPase
MPNDKYSSSTLLRSITPRNILSFGPESEPLPLGALNVLVGPNGSGKSNLIDCIALLRSTARDVRNFVRKSGGVSEWIWKGSIHQPAQIDAVVTNPKGNQCLRHIVEFRAENQAFRLDDERIENEKAYPGEPDPYFYYHYQHGRPVLNVAGDQRQLAREDVTLDESILVQRRDPVAYPEISYLTDVYEKIRIYREWHFGRNNAIFRDPQQADSRNDRLEEDFSNLGLFLNRLRRTPRAKKVIMERLRDLYDGLDEFDVSVESSTVQVFFTEGNFTIPATRLSDGSLRYLCLLAILCDPTPPPLICIEEPELGLHPDILPKLADLLVQASERTQLIVTTHSDIIVDALTELPEAVLICERHDGQTEIKRLNAENLKGWLEKYRLGELWTRGELGGTRW